MIKNPCKHCGDPVWGENELASEKRLCKDCYMEIYRDTITKGARTSVQFVGNQNRDDLCSRQRHKLR